MCADRAATLSGVFMKVTLGATTKVLGVSKYSMSGCTRKTVDVSEFGVDVDIFEFGSSDGGTITLSDMSYDKTDAAQLTFVSNLKNSVKFVNSTTSGIRFWVDSSSYFTIGTSGTILMTSAGKIDAERSGVAKTSAEGKVSGDYMILV